ncbi:MAG TPA: hypothetical protein VFE72_02605 [Lysobacter sp.]|nr:hypothetical protein [Lysobacter sp.]
MRLFAVALLAAAFALAGCTSIPLSTAMRLSSLDARTLAQLDPADVRVRVSLPSGFELDVPKSRLTLSLGATNGASRQGELALSLLQTTRESRSTGWFGADTPVSTYVLALSPDGVRQLRDMQQFALARNPNTFELGVSAPLAKTPAHPREMTFWADVKLRRAESWMRVIDGATVRFKATSAAQ